MEGVVGPSHKLPTFMFWAIKIGPHFTPSLLAGADGIWSGPRVALNFPQKSTWQDGYSDDQTYQLAHRHDMG